jgi:hypothetical protein
MNPVSASDESISLVDILVVILRWRVLIMVVTGAAVVIGFVFFWVLPRAKVITIDKDPGYVAQLNIKMVNVPGALGGYFDTSAIGLSQSYFTTLSLVAPVFQDAIVKDNPEYKDADYTDRGSFEAFIRKDIIGKRLKTSYDGGNLVLTVSYNGKNADRAAAFLIALNKAVRERVNQDMQPKIIRARAVLDEAFKSLYATTMAGTQERILAFSDLQQRRFMLEQLAGDTDFPFQQLGDVVILAADPEKDGTGNGMSARTGLLITVFGAFFVSIFLAFVLEYIRRLRNNGEEMAKLKAALGK